MKKWWDIVSVRIDALTLRERVFLFLSAIACCVVLADLVWLTPAQNQQRQMAQSFEKQTLQLQNLRTIVSGTARAMVDDPARPLREELGQIRSRLPVLDEEIRSVAAPASLKGMSPLAQTLGEFLKRHDGLVLVKTAATPAQAVVMPGDQGANANANANPGAARPLASFTRQGMELTVAGPFSELVRYVQTLELSLPTLRWAPMTLSAGQGPAQLTLQVFLVEAAP